MPRFIPACAGNAHRCGKRLSSLAVHPRVCGERRIREFGQPLGSGSSPRVRGTRPYQGVVFLRHRFIPACAGNASVSAPQTSWAPVHPRVCGERGRGSAAALAKAGSSPRVRGTPFHVLHHPNHGRFIPACAGNASPTPAPPWTVTVHPRVCGERASSAAWWSLSTWFIPACAGNARWRASRESLSPVHPRVCGERYRLTFRGHSIDGSSPRVRGTPLPEPLRSQMLRFIPACAGNAGSHAPRWRPPAVHPRVCGERIMSVPPRWSADGSSPRVRGTPDDG